MDFRQLEYLVELDASRNFTYAAEKLFVTHGALVHFLTKLEQEVGTTLFFRKKSGLIPTKTGELYVRMAKDMLKVYRRYQEAINEELGHSTGSFTVIGLPQVAETDFPPVYRNFKTQFPEITVEYLFSINDTFSCEQVLSGAADIAISFTPCRQQQVLYKGKLTFEKKIAERIMLVTPCDMPLPEEITDLQTPVKLSYFKDHELFCPKYDDIEQLFAKQQFVPKKIHYPSTAVSAFHYVKNGDGIGIIAPSGVPDHRAVRCLRLDPTLTLDCYLIHRAGDTLTKAQRLFCNLYVEEFRQKNGWGDIVTY